jgi:hypothetical protein
VALKKVVWRAAIARVGRDRDATALGKEALADAIAGYKTPAPLALDFDARREPIGRVLSVSMEGDTVFADVEVDEDFAGLALRPAFQMSLLAAEWKLSAISATSRPGPLPERR